MRGSRHAWDVRLISVGALLRLLEVKEEVDDPSTLRRIRETLIPHEFTKVDAIVDIVFAAAQDVRQAEAAAEEASQDGATQATTVRAKFNDACIVRVQRRLECALVRRTQTMYATPDNSTLVICAVSREHQDSAEGNFWFAFHPHQKDALDASAHGFVAFGCGSDSTVVLVPAETFESWLDGMNITKREDRFYWHVSIFRDAGRLTLHRRRGYPVIDLAQYMLP